MGLLLRDGSFLKEHRFQVPWTSHSLLIPSTWAEPGMKALLGSRHVRADLLLADLDVLQPVMTRAYGGWDSAVARGWNWDRWFEDWRSRLAAEGQLRDFTGRGVRARGSAPGISTRQPHADPARAAGRLTVRKQLCLLVHLSLLVRRFAAAKETFPSMPTMQAQHVRIAKQWTSGAKFFTDASYIAVPSSRGVPQAVRCGGDWIESAANRRASGGVN